MLTTDDPSLALSMASPPVSKKVLWPDVPPFSSVAVCLLRFTKIDALGSGHVLYPRKGARNVLSFRHISKLTYVNSKKRPALIVRGRFVRPPTTEPVGRRKQEKKKPKSHRHPDRRTLDPRMTRKPSGAHHHETRPDFDLLDQSCAGHFF